MRTNESLTVSDYVDVSIDVNVDDFLSRLDDSDIIDEAVNRGVILPNSPSFRLSLLNSSDDNRREMCEALGLNLHTPACDILKLIESKITPNKKVK